MANTDTAQNKLCRELGSEYSIRFIDLERVIYRDFHNGFDVEISGTHTASPKKTATIYLWFNDGQGIGLIVKAVRNVRRENISGVVDKLFLLTQKIIAEGRNNRRAALEMAGGDKWCNEDEL